MMQGFPKESGDTRKQEMMMGRISKRVGRLEAGNDDERSLFLERIENPTQLQRCLGKKKLRSASNFKVLTLGLWSGQTIFPQPHRPMQVPVCAGVGSGGFQKGLEGSGAGGFRCVLV